MTSDDALRLASWVEGLFVETTPQQVAFLADQFAAFEVGVVEAEVKRFRRRFDALNIANLLRRIAEEQQKRASRSGAGQRDRWAVDAQWAKDDAAFARLS